jgi:phytoene/squalene synthetase
VFRRRLSGYDELLFGGLPAALAGIGAGEAALTYLAVIDGGNEEDLLDALAEVCDHAFAFAASAAYQRPGESERAERVASLAHHLMMHESLLLGSPRRSVLHHDRALQIGRELGLLASSESPRSDA